MLSNLNIEKKVVRKQISGLPVTTEPIDYSTSPVFTADDYEKRIKRLWDMAGEKYTHFVIYGDREHFSNMEYFSGYDPRFEESLLILSKTTKPKLVIGVEGSTYAAKIPYSFDIMVYPPFSIPCYANSDKCQSSESGISLEEIFRKAGITEGSKVGILGWKLFQSDTEFDVPYFVMNALFNVVDSNQVWNVNELMIHNQTGLRHNLEAKEMVLFEISGTKSSRSIYSVFANLKEGINETDASAYMAIDGTPLNMHPNVNFGKNVFYGLSSPSTTKMLEKGDLVAAGMGYRRSVCFKIAFYAKNADELDPTKELYYDKYFQALTAWYESIEDGVTGGEVFAAIKEKVGGDLAEFGISINTGHLIHTDEWTNSPFYEGSQDVLRYGMALQSDFSAYRPDLGIALHEEDGVLIIDEKRQEEIKQMAPASFDRMVARRKFMIECLGIQLAPNVFPTSDLPGVVYPYLANMNVVLANE